MNARSLSILLATFIISSFNFIYAQPNTQPGQWTWVGGDYRYASVTGQYGTKGVPGAANFPSSRQGALTWTDKQGNFWLMGGYGKGETYSTTTTYLNDLWKYDTNTNMWTWVSGTANYNYYYYPSKGTKGVASPGNMPDGRRNATQWLDNDGNLWLMGGVGVWYEACINDLWKYDIATGMWTWMSGNNITDQKGVYGTKNVAAASNVPGCRSGAISWTDKQGNLWLMGGEGYATTDTKGYLNDLWCYDVHTNLWTWVSGSNTINSTGNYSVNYPSNANMPSGRKGSCAWVDTNGDLCLIGGKCVRGGTYGSELADIWRFKIASGLWSWEAGSNYSAEYGNAEEFGVPSVNNYPPGRMDACIQTDGKGNVWIMGGSYGGIYKSDLWRYNTYSKQWTLVDGSFGYNYRYPEYGVKGVPATRNFPPSRHQAQSWMDKTGKLWLMGGYGQLPVNSNAQGMHTDLWVYEPTVIPPGNQAKFIWIDDKTATKATIRVYRGDGSRRVILMKEDALDTVKLSNNITYQANAEYAKGSQVNNTGWYCVYNGTDTAVTVTGLSPGLSYSVAAVEYNGDNSAEVYSTIKASQNPIKFTTKPALSSIIPNKGILSPEFSPQTYSYTINLPASSKDIRFKLATLFPSNVRIAINGNTIASGDSSMAIPLTTNFNNYIYVNVYAGNESASYQINVKTLKTIITLPSSILKTYGDPDFEVVATSNNPQQAPITFSISDTTVAQVKDGRIHIFKAGQAWLKASQAASEYGDAGSAQAFLYVNLAKITVSATDQIREYGSANKAINLNYSGFVNGEDISVLEGKFPVATTTATPSSPAGTYVITFVTVPRLKNYYFSSVPGTLTITKARLTVTSPNANRNYGAANPIVTLTYGGFKNGDNIKTLQVKPVVMFDANSSSPVGKYIITPQGGYDNRYDFDYQPGTLTINRAPLTITAKNYTVTYGQSMPILTATYKGLANGEKPAQVFTELPVIGTTGGSSSRPGNYVITVSGGIAGNYKLFYTNGNLTVNKATLTVTALNRSRFEGEENPLFKLRYSGFVNADTETMLQRVPVANTIADVYSQPGNYPITVSNGYSPYYYFSYVSGSLSVKKATEQSLALNPESILADAVITSAAQPSGAEDIKGVTVHAGFSPNGDGANDYLFIENIEKYPDNDLQIITRNGVSVYSAKGYNNADVRFNGTNSSNKTLQPAGTYLYVLNYNADGQQKRKEGYVIIKY